ncbi:MAG TPA: hypothetical protein VGY66_24150, partial [Gemmataceae bacterium]|nr:hypothetical protein [Gemmataceae bacterium]
MTVLLFALSLLAVPAGVFIPSVRWLILGYDAALLLIFLADGYLAVKHSRLQIRRERPARLSVGIDNEIGLLLESISSRRLAVIMRDEPP